MDSAIQTADERMEYLTGDDDAARAYDLRFMGLCDYNSSINYAREEEREVWQNVVAEKDAEIARLREQLRAKEN